MKKYSTKILLDYIRGKDIEGIELDELEDDFDFMQRVINYSNDKNMLKLCCTRLQTDFEFIKFIIYKFRDDLDFIEKLASDYLKIANKRDTQELAIMMCKITGDNNKERFMQHYLIANMAFLREQQLIEECIRNNPEEPFGMGFLLIESDDENSDIMLEYFAERLIDCIPPIKNNQLAQILHQKFQKPEDFPQEKINSFLIHFISTYDISLANFVKLHIPVLNGLKKEIERILANWENFNQRQEWCTFQTLFERVHQYVKENCESELLEEELLYYIGTELGIIEKIKKYDYVDDEDIDSVLAETTFDKDTMEFEKFKHYSAVKKIMQDTLNGETSLEEEKNKNGKVKVIEMSFRKNEKKDQA